jgi:hypothetical protein
MTKNYRTTNTAHTENLKVSLERSEHKVVISAKSENQDRNVETEGSAEQEWLNICRILKQVAFKA